MKEAITTSALLRLPQQMSRKEKKQRVLDVIQQLVSQDSISYFHPNLTLVVKESAGSLNFPVRSHSKGSTRQGAHLFISFCAGVGGVRRHSSRG